MTIQDWGISYAELEPYYEKFERVAAVSGKAGNLRGRDPAGGNPFEAPRQREYPLPPLDDRSSRARCLPTPRRTTAIIRSRVRPPTRRAPTPIPTARKFGACQYCGYCQRFGCEANAKGSPHITVIPIAMRNPNFELRTHSWVTKVLKDSDGKRVTGVAYTNVLNGEEFEQPAGMVLLCAYAINNVHLMLLSGIGKPYDPVAQKGVDRQELLLSDRRRRDAVLRRQALQSVHERGRHRTSPSTTSTSTGSSIAAPHGFVGGYNVAAGFNTALPIGYRPVPRGTPQWGKAWKAATAKWYQTAMNIGASGSVMANRYNYFDLDPTYRNAFGQPLMRMTFDYKANEHKMGEHAAKVINDIAKIDEPDAARTRRSRAPQPWTVVPYQSTHNTGGTIMGTNPRESAREQISAELGLPQPVRRRRERVPAQLVVQSDRPGRRARLLDGGRDQEPLSEKSRPAGAGMRPRKYCSQSCSERGLPPPEKREAGSRSEPGGGQFSVQFRSNKTPTRLPRYASEVDLPLPGGGISRLLLNSRKSARDRVRLRKCVGTCCRCGARRKTL